jgi:hypothetical protein
VWRDRIDGGSKAFGLWLRKRKFNNSNLTLPQTEADCCVKLFPSGVRNTTWEVYWGAFVAFKWQIHPEPGTLPTSDQPTKSIAHLGLRWISSCLPRHPHLLPVQY